MQSDHRVIWLDLHNDHIYGFTPPTSISPSARRQQSNVPHIRNRWIQLYRSFLSHHNLLERQFSLESSVNGTLTSAQSQEYEKIFTCITYAENKCRKLHFGNVSFSPLVQIARLTIELWKAASTIKTGMKYSSRKFRRLEKKTNIFNSL